MRSYLFSLWVFLSGFTLFCFISPSFSQVSTLIIGITPPSSGFVSVNGDTLGSYPDVRSFPDSTAITLEAIPDSGYEFIYWELDSNLVLPGDSDAMVTFIITADDSVLAHFRKIPPVHNLVIDIFPPLSGNIRVDSVLLSAYPWSGIFVDSTGIGLTAIPASGYLFDFWESGSHTLSPSDNDSSVSFTITNSDTITAFFTPVDTIFDLTVNVIPPGSGDVVINSVLPGTYPWTNSFVLGTVIYLNAIAKENFDFAFYLSGFHILSPSPADSNVAFVITADDEIIAYFNPENPDTTQPEDSLPASTGPEKKLFIPDAFSPNSDGNNDEYYIHGDFTAFSLIIFDRWGKALFETEDASAKWNGKFKGKSLDAGIYTYRLVAEQKSGEKVEKAGNILLAK
ncbi:MAG: gliding motility-associated C-terminal domain-containing protein [Bacteroidetes bacterium]|nr:gliding motility-associated C-terminal domain-containing protein [Bacteroidota bacterium]